MKRWVPGGLAARIIGLTLLALLISQAVGYFSFRYNSEDFVQHMISRTMGQTVDALDSSLQFVEPEYRSQMVRSLSNRRMQYALVMQPPDCPTARETAQDYAEDFAQRMNVATARVRVCIGPPVILRHDQGKPSEDNVVVAMQRAPGQWLVVQRRLPGYSGYWAWRSLRNILITLGIMGVLVVLSSYRFTRPLRNLASAAERFGRGEKIAPVPVRGSDEIRRSIIEFNRMHERIDRFVAERTRLVAALAHDLRTPITALRLRLELLDEDENSRAMQATLEDMSQMSEAALTFMREGASDESARRIDLAALVDAVCEDYRASNAPVAFQPSVPLPLTCRPVAIRRALRNIIDNALAYGDNAEVTLHKQGRAAVIKVRDQGPGIAPAEMEAVFDAFVRLESSRSRETGGAGLGLAIARSVMASHGGDIELHNHTTGGLVVRMTLPI